MNGDSFDFELPIFVTGCECDHCQRARYEAWRLGMFPGAHFPPPPRLKLKGEVGYTDCCPWLAEE